jgi:alanine racemase
VPRSEITIDLGALRRNVRVLRDVAAPAEVWAVVKANAYGHGAVDVGRAALQAGAAALGVATAGEGATLRSALPEPRIVVLGPLHPGDSDIARDARLEVTVSTAELPLGLPVHLKVDTGMGRWGMTVEEAARVDRSQVVGVMSHLATADDEDPTFAFAQIERFLRVAPLFEGTPLHLANSAATIRFPDARLHAVRCGIAIYGLSPFGGDPADHELEPVLSWRSEVALVRSLAAGEGTGYGREFVAERRIRIGIVPVGYADGFSRGLSGSEVVVGGARRRVLGRVSMDAFAVELPEGGVGDPVTLIGDGLRAEELAHSLGTINYEVTCRIRSAADRARRTLVDE